LGLRGWADYEAPNENEPSVVSLNVPSEPNSEIDTFEKYCSHKKRYKATKKLLKNYKKTHQPFSEITV